MKPEDFVRVYYPFAKQVQDVTGVFAITILTRAAIESAWGAKFVGFNFFGIKDVDGVNGNEILVTTTEYLKNPNVKFPEIIKKVLAKTGLWKYTVKAWFRKYESAKDSFMDFANFLRLNDRYKEALAKTESLYMTVAICKAGYATDPESIKLSTQVHHMIENIVHINGWDK